MSELLKDGKVGGGFNLTIRPSTLVGGYDIHGKGGGDDSLIFRRKDKPNFFHRACCKFFLGWVWVDTK